VVTGNGDYICHGCSPAAWRQNSKAAEIIMMNNEDARFFQHYHLKSTDCGHGQ